MTARPLEPDFIWITLHARERLREHYKFVDVHEAIRLVRAATPIDAVIAAGLLHRPIERVQDRYFLAADRRGLFVVAERPHFEDPDKVHRSLVTYIRFLPSQVDQVNALWPEAA